ncbi:hypothetical protein IBD94_07085 [Francisella tularensis]|nr:hypothetical protein [Francisella tularensis]
MANVGADPFNDKSNPEDIIGECGISKAAVKRASGTRWKQNKIVRRESGIYVNG